MKKKETFSTRLLDPILNSLFAVYCSWQFAFFLVAIDQHLQLTRSTESSDSFWNLIAVLALAMTAAAITTVVVRMRRRTTVILFAALMFFLWGRIEPVSFVVIGLGMISAGFLGSRYERPIARRIEIPMRWAKRRSIITKGMWGIYRAVVFTLLLIGMLAPIRIAQAISLRNATIEVLNRAEQPLGLLTISGQPFDIQQHHGKTVVLHVWADWCGPCIATLPQWNELYEQVKQRDDIVFYGVSASRSKQDHVKACARMKVTWPQLFFDEDLPPSERLPVSAVPVNWVIGRNGRIIDGNQMHGKATTYLENLLGQPATTLPEIQTEEPRNLIVWVRFASERHAASSLACASCLYWHGISNFE